MDNKVIIAAVKKNSIADDLGLKAGDEILSFNKTKLRDILDYQLLDCSEEIELYIKHQNGEEEIFEIEKDYDEPLGIEFSEVIFDRIKPCTNHCKFCFIDQQPKGMRQSLYVKDDDYRLSYFHGTYVTLSNLTQSDRTRIEQLRLGPLYVSVHTTNPELRASMMGNPKAANIMEELGWLKKIGIPCHIQIVLCPGFNDREELSRTLRDLSELKDNILSVAIVPLGITKFRKDTDLTKVTPDKAKEILEQVFEFNANMKQNFVLPSDEFFMLAGKDFPKKEFYHGYNQLEDGVGTVRMLRDSFHKLKKKLPRSISRKTNFTLATGLLASYAMKDIVDEFNKINNLSIELDVLKSYFWGDDITVAGLITGEDIIKNLEQKKDSIENIIIPSVMLRDGEDTFLDDLKVEDVEKNLNTKLHIIKNPYSFEEMVNLVRKL